MHVLMKRLAVVHVGKEFWFDFGRGNYNISQDDFKANFDHLNFDKTLQYVYFPHGEVKPSEKNSYVSKQLGGCQNMVFFFKWLADKKVERILTVIVDDYMEPHSDEAIEEALLPFKIEVLDWRKIDLDTEVIRKVGRQLREVHLLWSGNNAALRAWSEPEGLRAIPTLRVVNLHVRKVRIRSKSRTEFDQQDVRAVLALGAKAENDIM